MFKIIKAKTKDTMKRTKYLLNDVINLHVNICNRMFNAFEELRVLIDNNPEFFDTTQTSKPEVIYYFHRYTKNALKKAEYLKRVYKDVLDEAEIDANTYNKLLFVTADLGSIVRCFRQRLYDKRKAMEEAGDECTVLLINLSKFLISMALIFNDSCYTNDGVGFIKAYIPNRISMANGQNLRNHFNRERLKNHLTRQDYAMAKNFSLVFDTVVGQLNNVTSCVRYLVVNVKKKAVKALKIEKEINFIRSR